jgi:hypothetical protein
LSARGRLAGLVGPELLELLDAYVDERFAAALAAVQPPESNGGGWLTLARAAEILDTTPDAVRMRAKRGRLETRHEGRRVYVKVPR